MNKEMSQKEIIEYLGEALKLETSIYTQNQAINNAKSELIRSVPKKVSIQEPCMPKLQLPSEPRLYERKNAGKVVLALIFLLLGFVFIEIVKGLGIFNFFLCAVCIFFIVRNIIISKKEKKEFVESQKQYQKFIAQLKSEYAKDQENAKQLNMQKKKQAQQQYEHEIERHALATQAVEQMESPLVETKKVLEKLYSLNIIYPKYRNLVAISSFYEYFTSGRVATLEGTNGAYNIFEQELRLNLIINKVDDLIQKLEDIKSNQYVLYTELSRCNAVLSGISSDVSELLSSSLRIEDAMNISVFCSAVTAQNTEALKYISALSLLC